MFLKTCYRKIISNKKFNFLNEYGFRGQLLVELLLAIALASVIFPAIAMGIMATRDGRAQQRQRLEALSFLNEAHEALRSVRERGWDSLYGPGTYYHQLSADGKQWEIATGSVTVNGFTEQIVISEVYRNNGVIVLSGGILDKSTKRTVITVSWDKPYHSSITSTMYLTRYLENDSYTETTQDHFNFIGKSEPGLKNGVTVQATNPPSIAGDGEIILSSGGHSNWCTPSLVANILDLPGQGYASAVTAIEGKAFAGTGENSSGVSFMLINITNNNPPVPSLGMIFDGYKTNGIFGEQDYTYIATDTNSEEVVIIGQDSGLGYFNAPGNGFGKSIFVSNNIGYVTVGNKLYNFDLSSKNGSRPAIDSDGVTLSNTGTSVMVVGNYAYVSNLGTSNQLQIVDISDTHNLSVVGQASFNGSGAVDLFVDSIGSRTYLAVKKSDKKEIFVIDTSIKTSDRPVVGSYDTGDMDPKAITVVPGNKAIIVGSGGENYQVIDISQENNLSKCGGVTIADDIYDIASVVEQDGDAYSYIVTSNSGSEFKIIEGGPGGSYTQSGIYESATFNPGYQTANNRFIANYSKPTGTDIKFQVSLTTLVDGNCPATGNYTFAGPDNTSNTYFTPASGESVAFPLTGPGNYSNPGQCFRYKVYMNTTNQTSTPVLYDITINYSP